MNINQEFARWATGGYAGMDGGDPKKKLWFCGIEPGKDKEFKFEFDISASKWISYSDSTKLPFLTPPDEKSDNISDQFNKAVADILTAVDNTSHGINKLSELYGESGNCFKLNLYPIPMSNHSNGLWSQEHYDSTGLLTKIQYKAWCMDNRFPKLRQLITEYNPKAIICFGTTLKEEYKTAFLPADEIFAGLGQVVDVSYNNKTYNIHIQMTNGGKTTLIVVPFPRKPVDYAANNSLVSKLRDMLKH